MADDDEDAIKPTKKFLVVGMLTSPEYQKSRYVVQKLRRSFPRKYCEPELRPMLNLEWDEYVTKMRRRHGKKFWVLDKSVAVFLNGEFLGDDESLYKFKYVSAEKAFKVADFEEIGKEEMIDHILAQNREGRKFAYLTVSLSREVNGTMLFELYNDLVPLACENFLARCEDMKNGYKSTEIHRIVENGWIQCGGFSLTPKKMCCENYVIPHNRRGVLSMCNRKRHRSNTTQFFITLQPTPWMDYRYVAFGQLVQGEEVLRLIEKVSTYYQAPLRKIRILASGEYDVYRKYKLPDICQGIDDEDFDDDDSFIKETKYKMGMYCLDSDLRSYFPFMPGFTELLLHIAHDVPVEEEANVELEAEPMHISELLEKKLSPNDLCKQDISALSVNKSRVFFGKIDDKISVTDSWFGG